MYEKVAALDVTVDGYETELLESETSSGFTRVTTVVSLHGDGETGRGEDVTYDGEAHYTWHESSDSFDIAGKFSLDGFSRRIGELDIFDDEPGQKIFRNYRRWAFESAALDLALKQEGTDLAERLERSYDPVRFVVSTRLEEPPTGDRVLEWLDRNPELEFKLDPTSDWTEETVERLASTDAVRALDLKGQYHGTEVDQTADPELYEMVVEGFPEAVIEDPELTDETRRILEGHEDCVSWDYPIRGVETVEELPWEPDILNIKPSRFGSVESLFDTIEYCFENGISMYGGGQFELGPGREHIQGIASLFYPESANDIAPRAYNRPEPSDGLPKSPLSPPDEPRGIEWKPQSSS